MLFFYSVFALFLGLHASFACGKFELSILNDTVIEPYVERIKLELVLFYLQHIDNTQQNKARKKIQKSSR